MKKKSIYLSLIMVIFYSTNIFATDLDVVENTDYNDIYKEYYDEGYLSILEEDEQMLDADKLVTRGELVLLLHEIFDIDILNYEIDVTFFDLEIIPEQYLPYVLSSYNNNIIKGKLIEDNLYFGFNDNLTKQEMLAVLGRYFNFELEEEILFNDANEVSSWAKPYVSYFYNKEILNLDENGNLNPNKVVTMLEMIEIFYLTQDYLDSKITNGYLVESYIGSSKIGFINDNYENSSFTMINDIKFNQKGEMLISDSLANQIRIASNDKVDVVVGVQNNFNLNGLPFGGYVDGLFNKAILDKPNKLLIFDETTVFFTEEESNLIRGYNTETKEVFTLAGNVISGYKNGQNDSALFNKPTGLAKDEEGNIYIADTLNNVIRKIDNKYNVTLYAGNPNEYGNVVGNINVALFNEPTDLFFKNDVLYVADSGNNMIKKIENNNVSIVAGIDTHLNTDTGTQIGADLDGNIEVAKLNYPTAIFVDNNDIIYIADTYNNKIKMVQNDEITTIAGHGSYGNTLGEALQVKLNEPSSIIVRNNIIYFADKNNHTVKTINLNVFN